MQYSESPLGRVFVYTLRDVKAGEEFTAAYGASYTPTVVKVVDPLTGEVRGKYDYTAPAEEQPLRCPGVRARVSKTGVKWQAQINWFSEGKRFLGTWSTQGEASAAYNAAAAERATVKQARKSRSAPVLPNDEDTAPLIAPSGGGCVTWESTDGFFTRE